jgi:hypothetical protein
MVLTTLQAQANARSGDPSPSMSRDCKNRIIVEGAFNHLKNWRGAGRSVQRTRSRY